MNNDDFTDWPETSTMDVNTAKVGETNFGKRMIHNSRLPFPQK
jgi:hypothetical protein